MSALLSLGVLAVLGSQRGQHPLHGAIPRPSLGGHGPRGPAEALTRVGIVAESPQSPRELVAVVGPNEQGVDTIVELRRQRARAWSNHGEAGGEILGELER